jgi:hypothetical protein
MSSRFALLAVLACSSGCGGGDAPEGKAGAGSLEALPALELWGYLRTDTAGLATESTARALDFDAIRQDTTRSHALIHVSGFT